MNPYEVTLPHGLELDPHNLVQLLRDLFCCGGTLQWCYSELLELEWVIWTFGNSLESPCQLSGEKNNIENGATHGLHSGSWSSPTELDSHYCHLD